jgi:hypothetical protein
VTLRHLRVLAFVLPAVTFAHAALAQTATPPPGNEPTTDQRALAEMLFFTGKGMMGDNRIAEACPKFAESYRLDPAAGTLLNLAVCHEKEGKVASAWGEFHQALTEAKKANRQDRIDLATEAIKRLEPDLPFVSIIVPKEIRVPGLEVRRNGVPLGTGAWDTELPIDPGTNTITAVAPLYKEESTTVTLQKQQHATVTLQPLVLNPIEIPPPPYWNTKRKAGVGLIVGGVVAAGVGAVFGGLTLSEQSTSNADCPTRLGGLRCTGAGASAESSAQTFAWVSDFGIGVGVAAIVLGGTLFGLGSRGEASVAPVGAPAATASTWDFHVTTSSHGGQGVLTHAF